MKIKARLLSGLFLASLILGAGVAQPTTIQVRQTMGTFVPQTPGIADGGGVVLKNANIELVFWGSDWANTNPNVETVASATQIILDSAYVSTLAQYHGIARPHYAGSLKVETPSPPTRFTNADVNALLGTLFSSHRLGAPNEATLYIVMTPPDVFAVHDLGEHDVFSYLDTSWPFRHQVHSAWVTFNGTWPETTVSLSHEIVEGLSDPNLDAIRVNSPKCGAHTICEIADVCDSLKTSIPSTIGDIVVADYWSEKTKRCIPSQLQFLIGPVG